MSWHNQKRPFGVSAELSLYQSLSLLVWFVVGLALRLHNLASKPPWTDEFSTLVFSLGHGFTAVPLNQLISAEQLLWPLQWDSLMAAKDTVRVLLTESNHPPLYFALTHQWMDGWQHVGWVNGEQPSSPYVSLWVARSLSACFGALSIPVIYCAAWWVWRSFRIAHFAAISMAISPFGIYLAQEARHYTLTVIWITGSLACFVAVMRRIRDRQVIPLWLGLSWVFLNGLGLATHYFFALSVLAEGIVLVGYWWWRVRQTQQLDLSQYQQSYQQSYLHQCQRQLWQKHGYTLEQPHRQNLWRVGAIALGTALAGMIWLPSLLTIRHGGELIRWVQISTTASNWSQPLVHTVASIASMVYMLPIQGVEISIIVLSGLTLAIVVTANIWTIISTLRLQSKPDKFLNDALPLTVIGGVCLSAIAIMIVVTYGLNINISPVFRYHFVYFPAVLLLMAWGLAQIWNQYRWMVYIILGIGLCGALTVTINLGYQKLHRPDQVVQIIEEQSRHPLVMAISHQSHSQTGRMMAVAWQMQHFPHEAVSSSPQFFLDHQPCDRRGTQNCNHPSSTLQQILDTLDHSYDLWLVNYLGIADLTQHHCDYHTTKRFDGYKVQHYTCSTQQ